MMTARNGYRRGHNMTTPTPPQPPPANGDDLPPHVLRLARMVARDCKAPGRYMVELTISPYPGVPAETEISTLSTIRKAHIEKRA